MAATLEEPEYVLAKPVPVSCVAPWWDVPREAGSGRSAPREMPLTWFVSSMATGANILECGTRGAGGALPAVAPVVVA